MEGEICWYKYTAISADKQFCCDYLETTDCPNMSDACKFLENQGYNIMSIKKIDYAYNMFPINKFVKLATAY